MPALAAFDALRGRLVAIERALLQGFIAGENGQALEDNPYLPGTTDNCAWDEGWKHGLAYSAQPEVPPVPL